MSEERPRRTTKTPVRYTETPNKKRKQTTSFIEPKKTAKTSKTTKTIKQNVNGDDDDNYILHNYNKKDYDREYSKTKEFIMDIINNPTLEKLGDKEKQFTIFTNLWRQYTEGLSYIINKFLYSGNNVNFTDKQKDDLLDKFFVLLIEDICGNYIDTSDEYDEMSLDISVNLSEELNNIYEYKGSKTSNDIINSVCISYVKFFNLSFEYEGDNSYIKITDKVEIFYRGVRDKPFSTINQIESIVSYLSTSKKVEVAKSHMNDLNRDKIPEKKNNPNPEKYVEMLIVDDGIPCINMNSPGIIDNLMEWQDEFIFPLGLIMETERVGQPKVYPFEGLDMNEEDKNMLIDTYVVVRHIKKQGIVGGKKKMKSRKNKKIKNKTRKNKSKKK